jgi:hypothetical protein
MKKTVVVIGVCLLLTLSFFSGCINEPIEITPLSIVSFDVEPDTINQGEYANLSWVVIGATSLSIDNGIGTVTLSGNRIIQPTETTTYILTALNETTTKSATTTITIIPPIQYDEEINITDTVFDICTYDYDKQESIHVTYQPDYPDVTLENLDIIKAHYTLQGTHATVSLKVRGSIENKGNTHDLYKQPFAYVKYQFHLSTLEEYYYIVYVNQTAFVQTGLESIDPVEKHNLNSSDFSVMGDTLTISFNLTSPSETYLDFTAESIFLSSVENTTTMLSDFAPNRELEATAYAQDIGTVGETIQFIGFTEPCCGVLPYEYYWDFGDGATSTLRKSTHVYAEAGYYTYIFTVTDRAGDTANKTGTVTITA